MGKVYNGEVLQMAALVTTLVDDVVVFTNSLGFAQTAGAVGDLISVDTVGVYEFSGENADAIAVGDILYWDALTGVVSIVSTVGGTAGVAWSTKAALVDGIVEVKIG